MAELPIVADPIPDLAVRIRIREIAADNKLSFYEAAFVELALRLQVPLQSFDKRVLDAVKQ